MSNSDYLTVNEFYEQIKARKTKKRELSLKVYLEELEKKYNIVDLVDKKTNSLNDNNIILEENQKNKKPVSEVCPLEYSELYIVNQSKKRFNNEIKNSHFLAHWKDLCGHPEIALKLRFIYNLINIKKDELINILNNMTKTQTANQILYLSHHINHPNNAQYFKQITNFLGIDDIERIKIDNQIRINKKTNQEKVLINFSIIINLEKEYPRNLISCPLDKVYLGVRHKKKAFNFVCHKDNMIDKLKTNKLCLSVWLIKTKATKIKMGTTYLSDTFPAEHGTVNDFIKEIIKLGYTRNAAIYFKKLKEAINNNYFYAIEYDKLNDKLNEKLNEKFKMKKSDKLTKKRLMIKK
jgi:hypothetical protein